MALLAPMPMPSVRTTTLVNIGNRISRRSTCLSDMNQHTPRGDQRFVLACLVAAFAAGYGAFGLIRHWRVARSFGLGTLHAAARPLRRVQSTAPSTRGP